MNLTECYKQLGIKLRNPRWSWSGISDDGKTVAVTLWKDRFTEGGTVYQSKTSEPTDWKDSNGFMYLMSDLDHAKKNTEGVVRIVIAAAENPLAHPRKIVDVYASRNLRMRVEALDHTAKTFLLRRVD